MWVVWFFRKLALGEKRPGAVSRGACGLHILAYVEGFWDSIWDPHLTAALAAVGLCALGFSSSGWQLGEKEHTWASGLRGVGSDPSELPCNGVTEGPPFQTEVNVPSTVHPLGGALGVFNLHQNGGEFDLGA